MIEEALYKLNNKEIILLTYLAIINTISFIIIGIDKFKARKEKYRISELTLLVFTIIGGASGTLVGMLMFRHKTNKKKFYIGVPIIYVITRIIVTMIFNHLR